MIKKELINLLQMLHDNIPRCTCLVNYRERDLTDPTCARHAMLTEEEIEYLRIVLTNKKIHDTAVIPPRLQHAVLAMTDEQLLIEEFQAAAARIFEWYDGKRTFLTERDYTYLPEAAAQGMTMLHTAVLKANKQ